ncbi:MAG: hypothetical protein ACAH65_11375, partial [Chloroflexota bacterium]
MTTTTAGSRVSTQIDGSGLPVTAAAEVAADGVASPIGGSVGARDVTPDERCADALDDGASPVEQPA